MSVSLEDLQAPPYSESDTPGPLLHSLDSCLTVPGPLSTPLMLRTKGAFEIQTPGISMFRGMK